MTAVACQIAERGLGTVQSESARALLYATLGIAGNEAGDLDLARRGGEQATSIYLARGDDLKAVVCLATLAETELRADRLASAAQRQLESLDLATVLGLPREIAFAAVVAARLAAGDGDWATAATLQLVADQTLAALGSVLLPTDREACDRLLGDVRARLGGDRYRALVADAAQRPIEDALTSAHAVLSRRAQPPNAP